ELELTLELEVFVALSNCDPLPPPQAVSIKPIENAVAACRRWVLKVVVRMMSSWVAGCFCSVVARSLRDDLCQLGSQLMPLIIEHHRFIVGVATGARSLT